ncbi:Ndr [Echinococcus multilocularis]|uniref:Ndr n=1 Tax=Echinococcus multilocularis TaxID=6211 RepID=U6HYN2_ECHMU|nr:Ndr [Echinococcus multilocularis]CDS41805.1 Ndr [Echinococcus multilocularis]
MLHDEMLMGAVPIHCTDQTAGFVDPLQNMLVNRELITIGMNPAAESFLIYHPFGYVVNLLLFVIRGAQLPRLLIEEAVNILWSVTASTPMDPPQQTADMVD